MSALPPEREETVRTEEVVEEEPARLPPRLWPWLLALLVLVLGGLLAYWLLARDDEKTTMPRVVGLTEAQARTRIAEAELEVDVDRARSERRAGIVFAQTPGAGTQLDEGQRVEIQVSSGLVEVSVPDVRELREAEAVRTLEEAGFEVEVQRVFAAAPQRTVVEQQPRGGTEAPQGSTVELKVSKGRNVNTVPDVVGRTEEEAVAALREREFEPRIFDVQSTEPAGTVVAQTPAAGAEAPPDSRVRINVSAGEGAGGTVERDVPNVVGLAQTPALRALWEAGFRGVVVYREGGARNRVLEQRPVDGMFRERRQVEVVVGSGAGGDEVEVPDVVDSREAEARRTLEDAGFPVEVVREGGGDVVVDQQPTAGTASFDGAVVTIVLG